MYPNVHSNIIYKSQDMETTYMFINRGLGCVCVSTYLYQCI